MDLQTQSTTTRKILHDTDRDRVIMISADGVDVYRSSDWRRIAWASIPNVTTGAVNKHGIWIGSSDAGIYLLPHTALDAANGEVVLEYATDTAVALPSNAIAAMDATGDYLTVAHDAGVSFFPSRNWVYNCTISGGADAVAITGSNIAYAAGDQIYIGAIQFADWETTGHTNITGAGTVTDLALRGSVLFIAGVGGIFTYSGSTVDDTGIDIGSATPTSIWPTTDATASARSIAFATSDGVDGGEYGIYNLGYSAGAIPIQGGDTGAVWLSDDGESYAWDDNLVAGGPLTVSGSGDTAAIWVDDVRGAMLHDAALEPYHQVAAMIPAPDARGVRRDWSIYAEITDAIDGIASGLTLKVNGQTVTPTNTVISNGYAVQYTPGSSSGYAERVTIELSATDGNGDTVSKTWSFVTASAPATSVTDTTPPNVVCTRDIGLEEAESDEQKNGINVIWLDDIAGPLIVTDAQAVARGSVAIDETTYHKHVRKMTVQATDANGLQTRTLQKGNVITMTCPAIGMTAQKCEVLAIQRKLDNDDELTFDLQIAYYEQVTA